MDKISNPMEGTFPTVPQENVKKQNRIETAVALKNMHLLSEVVKGSALLTDTQTQDIFYNTKFETIKGSWWWGQMNPSVFKHTFKKAQEIMRSPVNEGENAEQRKSIEHLYDRALRGGNFVADYYQGYQAEHDRLKKILQKFTPDHYFGMPLDIAIDNFRKIISFKDGVKPYTNEASQTIEEDNRWFQSVSRKVGGGFDGQILELTLKTVTTAFQNYQQNKETFLESRAEEIKALYEPAITAIKRIAATYRNEGKKDREKELMDMIAKYPLMPLPPRERLNSLLDPSRLPDPTYVQSLPFVNLQRQERKPDLNSSRFKACHEGINKNSLKDSKVALKKVGDKQEKKVMPKDSSNPIEAAKGKLKKVSQAQVKEKPSVTPNEFLEKYKKVKKITQENPSTPSKAAPTQVTETNEKVKRNSRIRNSFIRIKEKPQGLIKQVTTKLHHRSMNVEIPAKLIEEDKQAEIDNKMEEVKIALAEQKLMLANQALFDSKLIDRVKAERENKKLIRSTSVYNDVSSPDANVEKKKALERNISEVFRGEIEDKIRRRRYSLTGTEDFFMIEG